MLEKIIIINRRDDGAELPLCFGVSAWSLMCGLWYSFLFKFGLKSYDDQQSRASARHFNKRIKMSYGLLTI